MMKPVAMVYYCKECNELKMDVKSKILFGKINGN